MANETVFTGIAHPTDEYSDVTSEALVDTIVVLPLILADNLPEDTMTKYARKKGSLTASSGGVNEGANYTTYSQYSTTGVPVTVIKDVVASFVTAESRKFGKVDMELMFREQGEAIARQLDDEILALISGFTQLVTATSTLEMDNLLDAAYMVRKSLKKAAAGRRLRCVLEYKGANDIRKEVIKSAASVYTLPVMLSLLGVPGQDEIPANGYVGEGPGFSVFEVAGVPTSNGNNIQLMFDGQTAFYGAYDTTIETLAIPVGTGNPSFGVEYSSLMWHGVAEYNDLAGCRIASDS